MSRLGHAARTMRANVRLALPRPEQGRVSRIAEIHAGRPVKAGRLELAPEDLDGEDGGPGLGLVVGLPPDAADDLLGDAAVPDVVEIQLDPVEPDVDAVAAARDVLVVQGLVDVADEVHDEPGRLVSLPRRQRRVHHARGVVLDGRYDAALRLAVALQVDRARMRRIIFCVDEVEHARVVSPFRVADSVGPGRDPREIVGAVVPEEALEVDGRVVAHEVLRDVGYRDVPEACARLLVSNPSSDDDHPHEQLAAEEENDRKKKKKKKKKKINTQKTNNPTKKHPKRKHPPHRQLPTSWRRFEQIRLGATW